MSKNVLIVSTSLRSNSNSELLAKECERGAKAAGNEVEFISLKDKNIGFCKGCLACQRTKKCVIKDDAEALIKKVKNADSIIFASPIYYYEMSGQMKTFLDRCNPLYTTDYNFRDIYFISTAADDDTQVPYRAINGLKGWIDCFEHAKFKGAVFGGGINDAGAACLAKEVMKKAYDLGTSI